MAALTCRTTIQRVPQIESRYGPTRPASIFCGSLKQRSCRGRACVRKVNCHAAGDDLRGPPAASSWPATEGHCTHQDRVEGPDVHPKLQRRSADERIDLLAVTLELPFDEVAVERGNHRRVLPGSHHVCTVIQKGQVVAIRILLLADQHAVASVRLTETMRRGPRLRSPAGTATPQTSGGHQSNFVAIDLPCPSTARQRVPPLADKRHRNEQLHIFREERPEPLEELRGFVRCDPPFLNGTSCGGLGLRAQPLGNALGFVPRIAAESPGAQECPLAYRADTPRWSSKSPGHPRSDRRSASVSRAAGKPRRGSVEQVRAMPSASSAEIDAQRGRLMLDPSVLARRPR